MLQEVRTADLEGNRSPPSMRRRYGAREWRQRRDGQMNRRGQIDHGGLSGPTGQEGRQISATVNVHGGMWTKVRFM